MTLHLRSSDQPQRERLVASAWCGADVALDELRGDGTQVDCEACKRAWENVPRTVTNIELAEALESVLRGLGTPSYTVQAAREEITTRIAALRAPTRKWPFQ
jgi:hypothetical protein